MQMTNPRPARTTLASLAALAIALCSATALAQPKSGEGPPGGRGGPPAEALAACKTLKADDACSFTSDRGAASGSCWAPEGKPLACRPKDAPAPGGDANQAPRK